jgi:hypothetical protein
LLEQRCGGAPAALKGSMFLGDFSFPRYRLFVMGFTAVMLVGLWLFIEKTPFGLIVRIGSRKRFREMLDRIEIDGDCSRMQSDNVRLGERTMRSLP